MSESLYCGTAKHISVPKGRESLCYIYNNVARMYDLVSTCTVGVRLTPFIQTLHEDKGPAQFKLTREGEDDFAFDVTVSTNCPINNRLNAAKGYLHGYICYLYS